MVLHLINLAQKWSLARWKFRKVSDMLGHNVQNMNLHFIYVIGLILIQLHK